MRLYGDLKRFGREFVFDVATVGEVFRALCSQLPGFRQAAQRGHYRVRVKGGYLQADQLQTGMSQPLERGDTVHLVPMAAGAKSGWLGVVGGAVLIGAAFFTGGASLAAWGALEMGAAAVGAGLLLGGVASMLTPTPATPSVGAEGESSRNTSFSNLSNMLPQGRPVPLAYGEVYTGSLVISQGLYSE